MRKTVQALRRSGNRLQAPSGNRGPGILRVDVLAFAVLLSGGTVLFAWWLMGKTGVRRDLECARVRVRERGTNEDS